MITEQTTEVRKISLSVIVRSNSVTQEQATEIEERIRAIADDYENVDVSATRNTPRTITSRP